MERRRRSRLRESREPKAGVLAVLGVTEGSGLTRLELRLKRG